ncbi:MAG: hypothetical protein HRT72_04655 [Flavobacteriales bacterium]|nr:hypothetical protein [Flavobacteriales bacterium]
MNKIVLILLACIFGGKFCIATETWQITVMVSPSIENMSDKLDRQYNRLNRDTIKNNPDLNKIDLYDIKWSYNYGIEFKSFMTDLNSFSTGLFFVNKGYQKVLTYPDAPDKLVRLNAFYVETPAVFNWHKELNKKSRLIFSTGLHLGRLVSEKIATFSLDEDGSGKFSDDKLINRELKLYNPWYIGGNVGLGISMYVKTKMVLILQPNYTHQFNKAERQDAAAVTFKENKFRSFSFDMKLGYYFNRKLKNGRKKI